MTPDPKIDMAGAPVITLAGKEWFVPLLAIRQNRKVVPGLSRILPIVQSMAARPQDMTETAFNDIVETVYAALTRAYPTLTLDTLLDMTISPTELMEAIAPIARQTGMYKPVLPGETQGEAAPPTSTESSPSIARAPESPGPAS